MCHTPPRMDAPPPTRRFTRRALFRLTGAGLFLGLTAESVRVLALTNKHTVIEGKAYRTAQLSGDELARFIAEKKIRTVVNLRGVCPNTEWYLDECRTTHAAGISQEDVTLSAKRLPPPNEIRRLIDVLDNTEYPVVFHCQRGADRTGLAATAVRLLHTTDSLDKARRQLLPRYGHFPVGRTAVIDQFFDFYEAWLTANGKTHTPDTFRHWATNEYCPGPCRAELTLLGPDAVEVPAGKGFTATVRAKNTSVEPWVFRTGPAGGIQLRFGLYTGTGAFLYRGHAGLFDRVVKPGESIDLVAGFPPVPTPGTYTVHADLLDTHAIDLLDADFVQYGSEPLLVAVKVI
ncbi:MAG TPA: tyrosine-protein phosphatase [Gemmataceae bacterium]|nr:tyrosine-protein phosphatase [Gemmataceae bacterium]